MDLTEYSARHRHFLTTTLPPLLADVARPGVIADLGCGDGAVLWALHRHGLLGETTFAVDLSPERVRHAESVAPGVKGIVASAERVSALDDAAVDGVILSQVIEHVQDERSVVAEIARILRPGGWWYIGTVMRGRHAWWIYDVDGERRLDPTHVREYRTRLEFQQAIQHPELVVGEIRTKPMRFPVSDLALRAAARAGFAAHSDEIYMRHGRLEKLRHLQLRVPGYFLLEGAGLRI